MNGYFVIMVNSCIDVFAVGGHVHYCTTPGPCRMVHALSFHCYLHSRVNYMQHNFIIERFNFFYFYCSSCAICEVLVSSKNC